MIASSNALSNDAPIFLVGFMGAGKTTVGRALALHLRYDFFDLDELIEKQVGRSVRAIFAEIGESEFRRFERQAIQSCSEMVRTVIALGGGAYVSAENRASLRAIGEIVWLNCKLEVCLQRISGDRSRPLLGDEQEMRALLDQRSSAYAQADIVIHADDLSPEHLAIEIATMLRR